MKGSGKTTKRTDSELNIITRTTGTGDLNSKGNGLTIKRKVREFSFTRTEENMKVPGEQYGIGPRKTNLFKRGHVNFRSFLLFFQREVGEFKDGFPDGEFSYYSS